MAMPVGSSNTTPNYKLPQQIPKKIRKKCPFWGAEHRFTKRTSVTSATLKSGCIMRQWECKCGEKIWKEDPKPN